MTTSQSWFFQDLESPCLCLNMMKPFSHLQGMMMLQSAFVDIKKCSVIPGEELFWSTTRHLKELDFQGSWHT